MQNNNKIVIREYEKKVIKTQVLLQINIGSLFFCFLLGAYVHTHILCWNWNYTRKCTVLLIVIEVANEKKRREK